MRLRNFACSALIVGAAFTLPFAVNAQQKSLPAIGLLHIASPDSDVRVMAAFRQGLSETGYAAGRNVTMEYRWAKGYDERLPDLAADLVRRQVAVIVTMGGSGPARAATGATKTIPIVFVTGPDPAEGGLVASRERPGGNATGASWMAPGLEAKRLELLNAVVPKVTEIGLLVNPKFPAADKQVKDAQEAARARGLNLQILKASSEEELDALFAAPPKSVGALLVGPDPFFLRQRKQIVALTARHSLPVMYDAREYTAAGGLMSYGSNVADAARLAGLYAGRILKGEKPGDLPITQPSKYDLVLNLRAARGLNVLVPPALTESADEIYR